MLEINVKVRSGAQTLYDTKVSIELEETVRVLKKKICEKDESLLETLIEIVYCGYVMEDYCTVHSYDVFDGAMVHAFKQNSYGKAPVKPLSEAEISKVSMAFRQLTLNHTYRSALTKLTKNEVINNIMLMVPGLNEDPVAITLLFHSELLVKFVDQEVVKRIAESHPALAAGALQMAAIVHDALQAFSEVITLKTITDTIVMITVTCINKAVYLLFVRTIWNQTMLEVCKILSVMKM